MARLTPLLDLHRQGEALLVPYGPPEESGKEAVQLVAAFEPIELEYAAIRRHAAIFDQPSRATIVVTGPDRLKFLNNMLTQDLAAAHFPEGAAKRSFWLNRKGRIDADLRVLNLPGKVLLDVDVHALDRTLTGLNEFIIADDVQLADATAEHHRLALHGPAAAALLAKHSAPVLGPAIADLQRGQVTTVRIAGAEIIVDRQDTTGEIGLELLMPTEHAQRIYQTLSAAWPGEAESKAPDTPLARRIGWHAVNIARIEAGTAIYYADFGPDSLPHETGRETLDDRVSFKKGCYLGQEVVARMNALGHPKQQLVALKVHPLPHTNISRDEPQAETGTHVLTADEDEAPTVGAVTSSCVSPMLGATPICFAMVKWASSQPGTTVYLQVHRARLKAEVQPSLKMWKR